MSLDDDDCDFINVPAETPLSPEEAITRRHRREKRELQGKIQGLKKNVNKADKKKKKELTDEIAKMEADLDARHKAELDAFRPGKLAAPPTLPETVVEESHISNDDIKLLKNTDESKEKNFLSNGSAPGTPKMSRAKKRREKKEAEEKEKQKRIESESSALFNSSKMKAEDDAFEEMMKDLTLTIVDIDPDGNCLYNAVRDQLKMFGESVDVKELRRLAAAFLKGHKEDFVMFMDEEHGSDEGFLKYCSDLEGKPTWGGQLEVRILSQVLQRPIKVLQVEGVSIVFGENFPKQELMLTYHRYKYQLGEHYNSTKPGCS